MKKLIFVTLGICAVLFILFYDACDFKKDTDGPDQPVKYSKEIGPEGGSIITPEGYELIVPQGALDEEVTIELEPILNAETCRNKMGKPVPYFISGVALSPDGLQFNSKVSISMPLAKSLVPNSNYELFVYDDSNKNWAYTGDTAVTDNTGTRVTAEIEHFSNDGVFEVPPEFEILDNIWNYLENESDPQVACQKFADWYIQAMRPFDFYSMVSGCCYNTKAVEFNIGYKKGAEEGVFNQLEGTLPPESYPRLTFVYEDNFIFNGSDYIVSMNLVLYLGCSPKLTVTPGMMAVKAGESTSVNVKLTCNGTPMTGKEIDLVLDGLGSLSPSTVTTNSNGEGTAVYNAPDQATEVNIMAQYESCSCESPPSPVEASASISVGDYEVWKIVATSYVVDSIPSGDWWNPFYDLGATYHTWEASFELECTFITKPSDFLPGFFDIEGKGTLKGTSCTMEIISDTAGDMFPTNFYYASISCGEANYILNETEFNVGGFGSKDEHAWGLIFYFEDGFHVAEGTYTCKECITFKPEATTECYDDTETRTYSQSIDCFINNDYLGFEDLPYTGNGYHLTGFFSDSIEFDYAASDLELVLLNPGSQSRK